MNKNVFHLTHSFTSLSHLPSSTAEKHVKFSIKYKISSRVYNSANYNHLTPNGCQRQLCYNVIQQYATYFIAEKKNAQVSGYPKSTLK